MGNIRGAVKKTKYRKISKTRSGQALVEYVLVVGLAAILSVALTGFFNGVMSRGILTLNAVLESEVRTGGFDNPTPVQIWEN